jgi:hypothetical protein
MSAMNSRRFIGSPRRQVGEFLIKAHAVGASIALAGGFEGASADVMRLGTEVLANVAGNSLPTMATDQNDSIPR